jgi:hypothetical protein
METDRARQNEAILRYRIAIERGQEHMDEIGRCGRIEDSGARNFEYERLRERGKQLAEDEAVCREEYEKWHCEEITHLSADAFESGVMRDYEVKKKAAAIKESMNSKSNSMKI